MFSIVLLGFEAKKNEEMADDFIKKTIEQQDTLSISMGLQAIELSQEEFKSAINYSNKQIDSLLISKEIIANLPNRFLFKQSIRVLTNGISGIQQEINSLASTGMFLLMPIFAWLLYLFFSKIYFLLRRTFNFCSLFTCNSIFDTFAKDFIQSGQFYWSN